MFKSFENLKKQLFEQWKTLESRFLESNTFNLLKEKYQSLDTLQQALIKYSFFFSVFVVLSCLPLFYFFSSASYWREFKEKQNLSLDLLKKRQKTSYSIFRHSQDQLKSKIEETVRKYSDSDFQLKDKIRILPEGASIYQVDFDIQLSHLNVRQAVKLGTELHNMSQARLSSITMNENKDFPMHYDVLYKVSAFTSKEKTRTLRFRRKQPPLSKNKALNIRSNQQKEDPFLKKSEDNLKPGTENKLKKENKPEKNIKKRMFQRNNSQDMEEEDITIKL